MKGAYEPRKEISFRHLRNGAHFRYNGWDYIKNSASYAIILGANGEGLGEKDFENHTTVSVTEGEYRRSWIY